MTMVSLPVAPTSLRPHEEFVDLYALLKADPSAPTEQLRARISALYLEAQRNLDHHNFRKRFYYQQLFEVHLPQAYDSLLEPSRRAYYDACLAAYHQGEPFPPAPIAQSNDAVLPALGDAPSIETLSPSDPQALDPVLDAELMHCEQEDEEIIPSQSVDAAPQVQTPSHNLAQAELERRRDHKRRELIKNEVQSAAWAWGSVGGAAIIGASLIILAVGVPLLQRAWLSSISTHVLWGVGLLICALSAGAAFMATSRFVRRMVVNDLSQLPYEELLRRCSQ